MNRLRETVQIGQLELRNRLYRAPVLEGAGTAKNPAKAYAKHFVRNAKAGVGLIIQGNTIVEAEGRTSIGMSAVDTKSDLMELSPMVRAVQAEGSRIVIQLGHGGAFAIEAWQAEAKRTRKRAPLAPSNLPLWLRAFHSGVHVPSTDDVRNLIARFGVVGGWAQQAGYDGVQLAASNAKLLHQFLSRTYNRRQDEYGGSVEGRFRLLSEIRAAIAANAGDDFPVWLKFAAVEDNPAGASGITIEEGVRFAELAESAGFDALTPSSANVLPNTAICRGEFPKRTFEQPNLRRKLNEMGASKAHTAMVAAGMWTAAVQYPFSPIWNRPIFTRIKAAVGIPVFAVGGIRTVAEADSILRAGQADLIGIGRPFYAEPDLAARLLDAAADDATPTVCANCNQCVVPQMLGLPGVCYAPRTR